MSNTSNKRGRNEAPVTNARVSGPKWAAEFAELEEDDQYTYLEEMAKVMSRMHLQFLQGIMRFEDDEEEEEEGEFDDDDGEEGEEGEEGDGDD